MTSETADASRDSKSSRAKGRRGVIIVFAGAERRFLPYGIEDAPLVVGRIGAVGSLLPDDRLSRQHARIALSAEGWVVQDLGSRNGTYVDGVRVRGEARVRSPRAIRLADTLLVPCDDVSRAQSPAAEGGMVIGSALRAALHGVGLAASSSETLLLRGETGTGKELAARSFHELGPNARGPFVAVNCAAIPPGLAERLLLGAKRGAYSGATSDADGHLRAADRGVLFLDEAGDLDLQVQGKLLRVIETKEVVPLGASHGAFVSVRVCMATHKDLRGEMVAGRFRRDLYHRMAPPEVVLPPLRERLDEIAHHVVDEVARASPGLKPQARLVEACLLRHWPGNVRELRKHVYHAAVHAAAAGEDRVRLEDLPESAGQPIDTPPPASPRPTRAYVQWSKALTREDVEGALRAHGGKISPAARSLGMQRSQLYREMARLGIKPGDVSG
jgi:transcriptional regulator with GAF, ATPase, and Fis domain